MTTFRWLYYGVVAAALVLFATLPFSRQVSFWVLGFDQSLLHTASVDSFRAYRETAFVRVGLFWTCSAFVGTSFLLSLVALVQRGREGDQSRTTVPLVVMIVAALLASVLVVVYIGTRGPLL